MTSSIEFKKTGYFSQLICDYIDQQPKTERFYNRFPSEENLKIQAEEKSSQYSKGHREVLVKALKGQYANTEISQEVTHNLDLLSKPNTLTITTGHQLNLFSGPLYFVYKIFSVINLCEKLNKKEGSFHYVPVYWMATEDHDFLEINHFNFKGKKIQWNYKAGLENDNGYVGEYPTEGLSEVFDSFEKELGIGDNAKALKDLFSKAYLEHENLADATRYFVNELFKEYGLIIVDGNDRALKQLYVPNMLRELEEQISFTAVTKTAQEISGKGYKIQVNPRAVNLFYGVKGVRSRIEQLAEGKFGVVDKDIVWDSIESLKEEVLKYPERFSPNVLLRPLYQEVILPNIAYVGGGGELAYWFQLKEMFEGHKVVFPILMLRDSVVLVGAKSRKKLERLDVPISKLFKKQNDLINWRVRKISNIAIDFSEQREVLELQFEKLKELAQQTDKSFVGAVKAQEVKQLKGLKNLEKRLLKAQRIKLKDEVARVVMLQNELFPQQSLQERKSNFAEFYLEYGKLFFDVVKENLDPLKMKFKVISIE